MILFGILLGQKQKKYHYKEALKIPLSLYSH